MATLLVIGYSTLFIIIIIIIIKLFSGPWYVLPLSSLSFVCATKLRDRIENQYFDGGSSILSLHPTQHTHIQPTVAVAPERTERATKIGPARPPAPGACCHRSRREQTNQEIYYFIQIKKYNVGQLSGPRSYIVSHFCLVPARIFRDIFRVRGDFGQCFRFFLYSIFRVSILNILSPNVICLCLLYVSCVHGFGI